MDDDQVNVTPPSWYDDYGKAWEKVDSSHVSIFVIIILVLILYHFRHKIAQWHDRHRTRTRLRGSSVGFESDLESGLTSSTFDLHANINGGDSREGLSEAAAETIRDMMHTENISFDEARLRYFRSELEENGIGPDGMPTDRKTVTFGR